MLSIEDTCSLDEKASVFINKAGSAGLNSLYVTSADMCVKRAGSMLFDDLDPAPANSYHCKTLQM